MSAPPKDASSCAAALRLRAGGGARAPSGYVARVASRASESSWCTTYVTTPLGAVQSRAGSTREPRGPLRRPRGTHVVVASSPPRGCCADQSIADPAIMRAAVAAAVLKAISEGVGGVNLSMRRRLRTSSSSVSFDVGCCSSGSCAEASAPSLSWVRGRVARGISTSSGAVPWFTGAGAVGDSLGASSSLA